MVTAMDGSSSMIGSIDLKCEISPIISQAYMAARDICEYHYMTAPELDYRYVISSLTDCLGGKEAWCPTHFS